MNKFFVGKVGITITNLIDVVNKIEDCIQKKKYGYICVTNTRTTYMANKIRYYRLIQNSSLFTVPDGIPLVWIARRLSFFDVGRVDGPSLLANLLAISVEKNYSHYFYGSTPKTIKEIQNRINTDYSGITVKGLVSPPFQKIEDFNIEEIASEINKLKPTFFWCGLGAPKQEIFISKLQPKLESTICIGIGLAFEYMANTVKRPPKIFQKYGFEWIFRIIQQPIKARRFILPFFWMVFLLIKIYLIGAYRIKVE